MKRKLIDVLFISAVIGLLFFCFVKALFFPKDINAYENRPAEKMPSPTVQSVIDGSFQSKTDKALSDQFLHSETLKKTYNTLNSAYLKAVTDPLRKNSQNKYMELMGMKLMGGEYFCSRVFSLADYAPYFEKSANNINKIKETLQDVKIYGYYVEKDIDLDFETGARFGGFDYINEKLRLDGFEKFSVDSFDTYKKYFYKTDHHWNKDGSYLAYTKLVDMLTEGDTPCEIRDTKVLTDKFSGAYAKGKGISGYYETLTVNLFEYAPESVFYKGEKQQNYGKSETDFSYGGWYGIDTGEVIFESGKEDGENLLVIGDSYDNAVIELLSSHFNKLYSVDLRYRADFDIKDYAEKNSIDKILFIGCANFFFENDFEVGVQNK